MRIFAFADEASPSIDLQIAAMKRNGLQGLEIRNVDGENVSNISLEKAKEVLGKMKDAGLVVWSIGSPIGKIDIEKDDYPAHLEKLRHTIEIAQALESENIRLFSFYIPKDKKPEDFRQQVIDRMGEMARIAEGSGVTLCHENEKDIFGDTPQNEKALLDRFGGRLRAVLDSGNFAFCRFDPAPAYGLLKDYIDYMHIKDADAEGVIVPPGKGCALLEETLRSLNADYPDRELVLTMEPHLMMFTGLSSLSKLDDIKHKYSFSTPFEAFETATSAVREMLARL